MMSITPKITSISSLNCVMKTFQKLSNKKRHSLKIRHCLYWNKSLPVINPSTITISYTGISNQLTYSCLLILWKLLTSDLLSKTPISKKDKTITLVHLSICLMKLSMTIFIASKVIFGPLVLFSMKCLLEELHGEQKLNLISKECSKAVLSKIYFQQKSLKFRNNSLSNRLHMNHKIECHLKKFSDSLKDLHQTSTLEFNPKKCCQLLQDLYSEQEPPHKTQLLGTQLLHSSS